MGVILNGFHVGNESYISASLNKTKTILFCYRRSHSSQDSVSEYESCKVWVLLASMTANNGLSTYKSSHRQGIIICPSSETRVAAIQPSKLRNLDLTIEHMSMKYKFTSSKENGMTHVMTQEQTTSRFLVSGRRDCRSLSCE